MVRQISAVSLERSATSKEVSEFLKAVKSGLEKSKGADTKKDGPWFAWISSQFGTAPNVDETTAARLCGVFTGLEKFDEKSFIVPFQEVVEACYKETPETVIYQLRKSVDEQHLNKIIDALGRLLDAISNKEKASLNMMIKDSLQKEDKRRYTHTCGPDFLIFPHVKWKDG